jgi:integrase/recombinase XerC
MDTLLDPSAPVQPLALPGPTPLSGFSGVDQRRRELYDAWLAGLGANTLRAYRGDLADFAAFTGHPDPSAAVSWLFALDAGDANLVVLRYRANLTERGLKTATTSRRLSALKSLGKLARIIGACSWALEVAAPRVERYRDTSGPGAAGWQAMRAAAAADDSPRGLRDRAIVSLAHDLGLRRGSIAGIDVENLELDSAGVPTVVWVTWKGKQSLVRRTVPGPTGLVIAAWLSHRGVDPGPVFFRLDNAATEGNRGRLTGEAVRLIVRELGKDAGLARPVRPHGLRHQAITEAIQMGLSPLEVKEFAGHESFNTTQRYIDNAGDAAGRVAAMLAG